MKAGTIAFRKRHRSFEICLISSHTHQGYFTLPKGNIGTKETPADAARRESFEEAGISLFINRADAPIIWPKSGAKTTLYFPAIIRTTHHMWPEDETRDRLFVPLRKLHKIALRPSANQAILRLLHREAHNASDALDNSSWI